MAGGPQISSRKARERLSSHGSRKDELILLCGDFSKSDAGLTNRVRGRRISSAPITGWEQFWSLGGTAFAGDRRIQPGKPRHATPGKQCNTSTRSHFAQSIDQALSSLSEVNAELVRLVVKGLHNDEIGRATGINERTVRSRLSDLYRHFEVTNRTELVGLLIEHGKQLEAAGLMK